MATARLIGKLGGGAEWVPSGVTGSSTSSYTSVVTAPSGKVALIELDSQAFGSSTYRVDGGTAQSLPNGMYYIGVGPGQTLSVNSRSTAVRYVILDY